MKRHKGASVKSTELVCYSYPKVGVRVTFDLPKQPGLSVICDVASLEEVTSFGPDQKDGSTAAPVSREKISLTSSGVRYPLFISAITF